MQHWIELGMGLIAAIAVIVSALEGVRIWAAWRRSGG
jgi:hypothetical protein